MATSPGVEIEVDGHLVRVSSPDKVFFPDLGLTKLDLVTYYLAVGPAALRAVSGRPTVMKRYPNGITGDHFFQKRVPESRPEWLRTVTVTFPNGGTAVELCPADVAHLIWAVNLGCIDLNPWPVRRWDTDHPDELRVDLDPQPGVPWEAVIEVAMAAGDVLRENGLTGFPKTSGSRGIHINARILPRWGFDDTRRAALALAREVERRLPDIATSKWWKEERGTRVLLDYNQNARDRTVASAYSVRPVPGAWVSCPVTWDELPTVQLSDFTTRTVPARLAAIGDPHEAMDTSAGVLDGLLAMAAIDEANGLGDAPWPPHFRRQSSEARRVAPSKAKSRPPVDPSA